MNLQDFWRKKLGKYADADWSRSPTIFVQEVEKYFPKNCSVLELGVGLGQDSKYLSEKGFKVLATDFSKYSQEVATTEFKLVDMAIPLPFESESFEVIYSHLGIHYFDKERTIKLFLEMKNILKTGGILAILVNSTNDPEISEYKEIEKDYYVDESGISKRFFSIESMKKVLTGFEIILLDNLGVSRKDEIKNVSGLIRLVARKT
ncbi:MAG: class I SAM-dependent methyltransferase [Microgenomates group bacterium]